MSQIDDFLSGKPVSTNNPAGEQKDPNRFNKFLGEPPGGDNALMRGIKTAHHSAAISKDLAAGDADEVARRVQEYHKYQQANPGSKEGRELYKAWEDGDGISGGIAGVAGEMKKDWDEGGNWVGGLRNTARNVKAMGEGIVGQVGNMIYPTVGMVAGGLAGGAAGSAVPVVGTTLGAAAGAWAGGAAGNAAVEGGSMFMEKLHEAGINPEDIEALPGRNGVSCTARPANRNENRV